MWSWTLAAITSHVLLPGYLEYQKMMTFSLCTASHVTGVERFYSQTGDPMSSPSGPWAHSHLPVYVMHMGQHGSWGRRVVLTSALTSHPAQSAHLGQNYPSAIARAALRASDPEPSACGERAVGWSQEYIKMGTRKAMRRLALGDVPEPLFHKPVKEVSFPDLSHDSDGEPTPDCEENDHSSSWRRALFVLLSFWKLLICSFN